MQNISPVDRPLKINFRNPRWQTASVLERPILHHKIIAIFLEVCMEMGITGILVAR